MLQIVEQINEIVRGLPEPTLAARHNYVIKSLSRKPFACALWTDELVSEVLGNSCWPEELRDELLLAQTELAYAISETPSDDLDAILVKLRICAQESETPGCDFASYTDALVHSTTQDLGIYLSG